MDIGIRYRMHSQKYLLGPILRFPSVCRERITLNARTAGRDLSLVNLRNRRLRPEREKNRDNPARKQILGTSELHVHKQECIMALLFDVKHTSSAKHAKGMSLPRLRSQLRECKHPRERAPFLDGGV